MNEQEKDEIVLRCKANRRNIHYINKNLNPDAWIKNALREINKPTLNRIIDDLEHPTPPPDHVCEYPLSEVEKVNGWSAFGYEALVMRDQVGGLFDKPILNDVLWAECADLLAKNAVNYVRFFSSFTPDAWAIGISYHPVVKKFDGTWDCTEIDPAYIAKISPRLEEFHKRKIMTEITLGSEINGDANQWANSYFNGKNNTHGTTHNVGGFYGDEKTMAIFREFIQNYAITFNSPYVKFRLIEEPRTTTGRMVKWNNYMIKGLNDVGVPNDRIMIQMFDSSKVLDFLDKGIWVSVRGINSERTIRRWFRSGDRRPFTQYPNFLFCGSRGDERGKALGLVGLDQDRALRKAAAVQEANMIRMTLQNGGSGIDFAPALVFVDGKIPNLTRIKEHGERGFTKEEIKELKQKLGIDINPDLNCPGELEEVRAAFVNNL